MTLKIRCGSRDCDKRVHGSENVQHQEDTPGVPHPPPHIITSFPFRQLQKKIDRAVHRKHRHRDKPSDQRVGIQKIKETSTEDSALVELYAEHAISDGYTEQQTGEQTRRKEPEVPSPPPTSGLHLASEFDRYRAKD